MSSSQIDEYVKRLRQLANEFFPNIAQGNRPILGRINDLRTQANVGLENRPILNAVMGGQQGPIRKFLNESPLLKRTTQNLGTRITAIGKLAETQPTQPQPILPQQPLKKEQNYTELPVPQDYVDNTPPPQPPVQQNQSKKKGKLNIQPV